MPVSNISWRVDWSSNDGAGRWIGIQLLGVDRAHLVHRLADHVQHAAQRFVADRHFHRMAQADGLHAAHQALGGLQRDGAHAAFADMLLHFADDIDGLRVRRSPRW
jgi:hypothetical protein